MADAYGVIVFAKSKDCEYFVDEMLETLSAFSWGHAGQTWKRSGEDSLYYGEDQYPSLFPQRTLTITVEDADGTERTIDGFDATEDDYYNQIDSEEESVTLAQLGKAISEHIREGWIEIAAIANENLRYAYFQSIRVFANGNAVRKHVITSIYDGHTGTNIETYDARTGEVEITTFE
jgi:hypothetical protein